MVTVAVTVATAPVLHCPKLERRACLRSKRHRAPAAGLFGSAQQKEEAPAVLAEDVRVTFNATDGRQVVQALKGASLRVPRGTLHMLLGPNGCGKARRSGLLRRIPSWRDD